MAHIRARGVRHPVPHDEGAAGPAGGGGAAHQALWTEPLPTFTGRHYYLNQPPYNPPNVQEPHPPILIGGGGEKRTLRIVAQYADAANVSGTPEEVRHKFDVLETTAATSAGRPTIRRTIQVPLFLTDDPIPAARGAGYEGGAAVGRTRREIGVMGGVDEVKEGVEEFVEAGVQEFMWLAQWPRFHRESLQRFSADVIPAFR